jgi:hypothetical protein
MAQQVFYCKYCPNGLESPEVVHEVTCTVTMNPMWMRSAKLDPQASTEVSSALRTARRYLTMSRPHSFEGDSWISWLFSSATLGLESAKDRQSELICDNVGW